MTPILISNCPISNLSRKLTYDFYWLTNEHKIVIMCFITHYLNNEKVENSRIKSYQRPLIASDTKVSKIDGHFLTEQEITQDTELLAANWIPGNSPLEPPVLKNNPYVSIVTTEYEYYVNVLGVNPVILPTLLRNIILLRDSEGKFNN